MGIPWDGRGWDRHNLLWDGMGWDRKICPMDKPANHKWNAEYCESTSDFVLSYPGPVPGLLK